MNIQEKLVDAVLDQIAEDVSVEDFTAIKVMLKHILNKTSVSYTHLTLPTNRDV